MDTNLVFQALADSTRRTLLERIHAQSGQSLSMLAAGLSVSRQATAKHMAILETAELVVSRRVGRERHHYLNPLPFRAISGRWLRKFEQVKLMDLMPESKSDT
ncbi:MAG: helix-turn-helix domain-containing protein [Devosiaceae bacterium]|nr:helix-turn-helix domain-containing protein [Devosiaceae bacterium]